MTAFASFSNTSSDDYVKISPCRELDFRLARGKYRAQIEINNITTKPIIYKVRTTTPGAYLVNPTGGKLIPKEKAFVTIYMPNKDTISRRYKDKFLVQAALYEEVLATVAPDTKIDESQCNLSGVKTVQSMRLKVHFDVENNQEPDDEKQRSVSATPKKSLHQHMSYVSNASNMSQVDDRLKVVDMHSTAATDLPRCTSPDSCAKLFEGSRFPCSTHTLKERFSIKKNYSEPFINRESQEDQKLLSIFSKMKSPTSNVKSPENNDNSSRTERESMATPVSRYTNNVLKPSRFNEVNDFSNGSSSLENTSNNNSKSNNNSNTNNNTFNNASYMSSYDGLAYRKKYTQLKDVFNKQCVLLAKMQQEKKEYDKELHTLKFTLGVIGGAPLDVVSPAKMKNPKVELWHLLIISILFLVVGTFTKSIVN